MVVTGRNGQLAFASSRTAEQSLFDCIFGMARWRSPFHFTSVQKYVRGDVELTLISSHVEPFCLSSSHPVISLVSKWMLSSLSHNFVTHSRGSVTSWHGAPGVRYGGKVTSSFCSVSTVVSWFVRRRSGVCRSQSGGFLISLALSFVQKLNWILRLGQSAKDGTLLYWSFSYLGLDTFPGTLHSRIDDLGPNRWANAQLQHVLPFKPLGLKVISDNEVFPHDVVGTVSSKSRAIRLHWNRSFVHGVCPTTTCATV